MSQPRSYYEPIVESLLKKLKPYFTYFEIAGSHRRGEAIMSDVDVVCIAETDVQHAAIGTWIGLHGKVTRGGDHFVTAEVDFGHSIFNRKIECAAQVDFKIHGDVNDWPAAMLHFTGSKEHNIKMRQRAKAYGFKLNEYGLWLAGQEDERVIVANEACLFEALGMSYVKPEDRK